jgi:hypothetical protein
MKATEPVINKILAMFAPKILPITISELPLVTESIDVTSSGKDVPTPIIKTPIINGGKFQYWPIFSAALVKNLAAKRSTASAITNCAKSKIMN